MCATPDMPEQKNPEVIATPTSADASVTKAGQKTREQAIKQANANIQTSEQGLNFYAETSKNKLMGE